jgi:hypothetical protein
MAGRKEYDMLFSLNAQLGSSYTGTFTNGNAEQLYHIGKLEPGRRKEAARAYVIDVLKLAGVDITPEVGRLIDGVIEAEVLGLGHKVDLSELAVLVPGDEPPADTQNTPQGE